MYRTLKAMLILGLMATLALIGCGDLSNKGNPPSNNPPKVFFANIPVDGTTFSVNPTLYWYGTDNDGTIEQYQYAVIPADLVDDYLADNNITGSKPPAELFIDHAPDQEYGWATIWVDSVQTATRDDIRLYATFDTNFVHMYDSNGVLIDSLIDCDVDSVGFEVVDGDTVAILDTLNCVSRSIAQYMFIRAIDDDNAASDIKYRSYMRNNHWPQTKIENRVVFSAGTYLNIGRPTVTYAGIPISWTGSDSTDYPRNQPDFEFWWRVFGPFDSPGEADTLAQMLVLDSGDSLVDEGWIKKPTGIWTTQKTATLIDLWRIVNLTDPSDVTREGYFLFDVRARDDAFAPDPTPSWVTFRVIDAKLERPLLFIDDAHYGAGNQPLTAMGSGAEGTNDGLLRNRIFEILFDAVGIEMDSVSSDYYRRANGSTTDPTRFLPIELLARYSLILLVDDDDISSIPEHALSQLARYMNIGGNLWVFGRNSFLANNETPSPQRFPEPTMFPTGPVAEFYFDAEEIYMAAWTAQSIRLDDDLSYHFVPGFDDFIGANLTDEGMAAGLPYLQVDTALTKDYYIVPGIRAKAGIMDFRFETIPDANFIVRGTAATPIYKYVSRYAGTAFPHNKVCAIRYIGPSEFYPVYKTAWFSFSPYAIKTHQLVDVFRTMIAWFNEDPAA